MCQSSSYNKNLYEGHIYSPKGDILKLTFISVNGEVSSENFSGQLASLQYIFSCFFNFCRHKIQFDHIPLYFYLDLNFIDKDYWYLS